MIDILRIPDTVNITVEDEHTDAAVRFVLEGRKLHVYLTAEADQPRHIRLRWNEETNEAVRVLGDAWERTYSENGWMPMHSERFMPWYFMVTNSSETVGCGVMTDTNAFVSFEYDADGVTMWCDVRCGAKGVQLCGRELLVATVVCEHYTNISSFEATQKFCAVMHEGPRPSLPPVYGSNNWYYAYSETSRERVLRDCALLSELTAGIENRPYMMIDSGWEQGWRQNVGPWFSNERFGDMPSLVSEMKRYNIKPGLWLRPLCDPDFYEAHPACCTARKTIDPSHPEAQSYLREVFRRVKSWGFEAIKHDFTFFDMFGKWGKDMGGAVAEGDWAFYDRSKTGAEIARDFYKLMREETAGMMIIACNVASHIAAGWIDLNRIADDTSGREWVRTMVMGVHGLAYRLPQNGIFYMADADCVGIIPGKIPWELNAQWTDLLARSGAPFFASVEPETVTDEVKTKLRESFLLASEQKNVAIPLDWEYNMLPTRWCIDEEEKRYNWMLNFVPPMIEGTSRNY